MKRMVMVVIWMTLLPAMVRAEDFLVLPPDAQAPRGAAQEPKTTAGSHEGTQGPPGTPAVHTGAALETTAAPSKQGGPDDRTLYRVTVRSASIPPSRTRILFDRVETGDHSEIQLDPRDAKGGLVRTILLREGTWQVSLSSVQQPHPVDPSVNLAWEMASYSTTTSGFEKGAVGTLTAQLRKCRRTSSSSAGQNGQAGTDPCVENPKIYVSATRHSSATQGHHDLLRSLDEMGRSSATPAGAQMGGRGFGIDLDTVARDLAQAAADVAMSRVETYALQATSERVQELLGCQSNGASALAELDVATVSSTARIYMPATCVALQSVRLRDLAMGGRALDQALRDDLLAETKRRSGAAIAASFTGSTEVLSAEVASLTEALAAVRRGAPSSALGQMLVHDLGQLARGLLQARVQKGKGKLESEVEEAILAVAAIAACEQLGHYDPKSVTDILTHPQAYFGDTFKGPKADRVRALQRIVADAADVVFPAKSLGEAEIVRRAIHVHLDVLSLLAPSASAKGSDYRKAIAALRRMADGLLEQQTPEFVLGAVDLVSVSMTDDEKRKYERASKALAAVTSYASTYVRPTATDSERKLMAMRRQQALDGVIELATDRSERMGGWRSDAILSAGAAFGGIPIGTRRKVGLDAERERFQLALPMGIALDVMMRIEERHWYFAWFRGNVGLHAAINAIDLGQYVSFDENRERSEPEWDTALMVGGQLGITFGDLAHPFIVGVDLRHSPAAFPRRDKATGAFREGASSIGLFVGWYIPFFDLN